MKRLWHLRSLILVVAFASGSFAAYAQETFYERFRAHNQDMTALQPYFITPLVEADPRLVQVVRATFSNQYTAAGTQTVNYGNSHGISIIAFDRLQFDVAPPSYIQHNLETARDGLSDTAVQGKYRIVSGNAEHGNYILTAILAHSFATGTYKNGALTDAWIPTLAGGIGLGRTLDVESSLSGTLPTGRIAVQGRSIGWDSLIQAHFNPHVWFELENNASFYFGGSHDGKMQNFVTPGAYYVIRRKNWKPTHAYISVGAGMQIATSGFHTYNHNLITDLRILY